MRHLWTTILLALLVLPAAGCMRGSTEPPLPDPVPVPGASLIGETDVPTRIRDSVDIHLETRAALQLDGDLYLVAASGEKPTGGYHISFKEYRDRRDHTWDVFVETSSPAPGENVTEALTYPVAFARFSPQIPVFQVRFYIDGVETELVAVEQLEPQAEDTEEL